MKEYKNIIFWIISMFLNTTLQVPVRPQAILTDCV